jgi:hypothetical protein
MLTAQPRMPHEALPSRLLALLESLTDRHLAERLERVYRAAAVAMDQLSYLNIVKYEPTTAAQQDGADLSLWETMAPALRDTLVHVNHLIAVIREHFPAPERTSEAGRGWRPPPASADERLSQEVEAVFQTSAERLSRRVAEMGERVRRPEVVTDRWELMTELQAFRLDFRTRLGELVYLTAAAFEDVSREEVVPGHGIQTAAAAALRGALVDLRRSLTGKLERMARTAPEALPALTRQVAESLGSFATMPATLTLRTRDKRLLVQLREALQQLGSSAQVDGAQVASLLQGFLAELDRMTEALTTQQLAAHDRAVWSACGARLEQVRMHLDFGSPGAERVLLEALERASQLYGRSETFDTFVRKNRRAQGEGLEEQELRQLMEQFREKLSALPFH